MSLGALRASAGFHNMVIRPIWAVDINKDACDTYAKNISANVICAPVEHVDTSKLPNANAIVFGLPCNDYSVVGEKRGLHGKYGALYSYAVRAIEEHNPLWFVAENVVGLRSSNKGTALPTIMKALATAGIGYDLTAHLYKFEQYGVPQIRHRIIIVGIRKDVGLEYRVPYPTTPDRYITAEEAITNPPIPANAPNHEFTNHSPEVVARLKSIKPGHNAWNSNIPDNLAIHTHVKISQIYRRLDPSKPAYTVTGSGGGGTHVYHWAEPRALTNRERARLQTFPDDYEFCGTKESVRRQIGMAVPPKAAEVIVTSILKTFAGVPYEHIQNNINI